jgi:hypothetical protein
MKRVLKGEKLEGYNAYLNDAEALTNSKCNLISHNEMFVDSIEEMMKVRAAYEIKSITEEMMASDLPQETVWNEVVQVDLVNMARSHLMLITF